MKIREFEVSACAPDLELDWQTWIPTEALQSTRNAMQLANDYLNITPVIFLLFKFSIIF